MKRLFHASAIFAALLSLVIAASAAVAADLAPADNPPAGDVILENSPAAPATDTPQAIPAPVSTEQAAPTDSSGPGAVDGTTGAPVKKDSDAVISEGKDLAIEGALTGDRLKVRAGRRMIRDGALLKRSQQLAQ